MLQDTILSIGDVLGDMLGDVLGDVLGTCSGHGGDVLGDVCHGRKMRWSAAEAAGGQHAWAGRRV